eukprot:g28719.t1
MDVPINLTNLTENASNETYEKLEEAISENLANDIKEAASIPNLENHTNQTDQSKHGFGQLGANLEFLMLKVAQLETIVELQQIEIHKLNEWKSKHMSDEHNSTEAASEIQSKAKTQNAVEVLKKVLDKHNRQRENRDFGAKARHSEHKISKSKESSLLQRQKIQASRVNDSKKSLDSTVASKVIDDVVDEVDDVGDAVTDGTGLVGDALGDAYESAADQVSFVANTVIDSVEMAVDILIRGFTDWNAGCDENRYPSMDVDSNGLRVDWGRQKCWVRLMGQTCTLFDFNFGNTDLSWPEPLKTVVGFGIAPIKAMISMGTELVNCATIGSPVEVIKCFGFKIIELVPPLSTLNRLSDMLSEFIEVFAKVAATVVRQVLEDKQSLVQQAVESKFPAAVDTKLKALAALRDFTAHDVKKVVDEVPPPQLIPGSTIALYSPRAKRFLRMNSNADMDSSGQWDVTKAIPYDWSWERFTVVDAGSGQLALHSSIHNRFVRMARGDEMDVSGICAANLLPGAASWTWERFTAVNVGKGQIAFHNKLHNRYIRMSPEGIVDNSAARDVSGIPDSWSWERWQVVEVAPYLKPGSVVALHSAIHNRFLRMNDQADMDRSGTKNANELPDNWSWERFTVVEGQNGQVALHSAKWNRFIKMSNDNMEASVLKAAADLPPPADWTYERFAIVPAGKGEIALHNTLHNRFIRMTNDGVDSSGHRNAQDLPSDWTWERFRVVEVSTSSGDDGAWSFDS